jgi:hypothetical protein
MHRSVRTALLALAFSCLAACGGSSDGPSGGSSTKYGSATGGIPGATWNLETIAHGDGIYVATGMGGLGSGKGDTLGAWVETGTDGLAWRVQESGDGSAPSGDYTSLAFGAGVFIAVDSIHGIVFESHGGERWEEETLQASGAVSVSWDGTEFLVKTETDLEVSADGAHWHAIAQGTGGTGSAISAPIKVGDVWYAIVDDGPSTAVGVSSDLKTYTAVFRTLTDDELLGVTYLRGRFIAFGANGRITTSTDGTTWVDQPRTTADQFDTIVTNGSVYVAEAIAGGTVLLYSTDAIHWTSAPLKPAVTADMAPGALTVGSRGSIVAVVGESSLVSTDGVLWSIGG